LAWQSAAASWAARCGVHSGACLEAAHGNDLLPLPDLESEGAGSLAEDGVGAVVERLERGDHAATPDPDEAGAKEISQELAWQLVTRIVPGQRKLKSIQKLQKKFEMVSTEISFDKTIGAPKTA
jgi:hypothetical protein